MRNDNSNKLLLICFGLLITPTIERGSFSVLDALLYMIRDLTETTPWDYECVGLFASDRWRETGKQLGIGAVFRLFEHDSLMERIRQEGS